MYQASEDRTRLALPRAGFSCSVHLQMRHIRRLRPRFRPPEAPEGWRWLVFLLSMEGEAPQAA
jgi:hypothetical protein